MPPVPPTKATGTGQPWNYNVCPQCAGEVDAETSYKRCSRCGLHQRWPAKGWTPYWCPKCHREYARERRARLKAQRAASPPPTPEPEMRECSKCHQEHVYPAPSWTFRRCPECTRQYHRQYKKSHGPTLPPKYVAIHRESMKTCSRCKQRSPYSRPFGWRGDVCGRCQVGYRRTSNNRREAKEKEWRANATPVECRTCHENKPYGVGWNGRLCRECQAVRAAKQYAEVKASPERLRARKAKQEEARRRRQARHASAALAQRGAPGAIQGGSGDVGGVSSVG